MSFSTIAHSTRSLGTVPTFAIFRPTTITKFFILHRFLSFSKAVPHFPGFQLISLVAVEGGMSSATPEAGVGRVVQGEVGKVPVVFRPLVRNELLSGFVLRIRLRFFLGRVIR